MTSKTLKVGESAAITHVFTDEDVRQFAQLSTDRNPIHLDDDYAATTRFERRLVHGMLVGSLFSALLGDHLPGHGAIYMQQNLKFTAPVFLDMEVTARVEITAIDEKKPIVTLETRCTDAEGNALIVGDAVMYVPWLREGERPA